MSTVANVSAAKPKVNGAVSSAPLGTALPTTATEPLNAAFAALGYVSDAGVANANSPSTTNVKAWGGDVVLITEDEKPDTFKLTLIEGLNVEVLKTVYGDDKVSGTLETGISIAADAGELEEKSWVVDMLLRGNVAKRIVIPRGKLSSLEEIAYRDNEVIGYGITIACLPDSSGKSHYEYIKAPAAASSASSAAPAASSGGSDSSGSGTP
ncbi:MAG: phage tail protein [Oscillospiraceae bacterium]|nr:phage tail protein [Oscillospiraceae bacterium]